MSKVLIFGSRSLVILLFLSGVLAAQAPRFYAISASLSDAEDTLVAYSADAEIITVHDFQPDNVTPTFLTTDGDYLYTNLYSGQSGVYRREVGADGPFELFAPLGNVGLAFQIEFDAAGNLYSLADRVVRRFDSAGNETLAIPTAGDVWGVDADSAGNIYVADAFNSGDIRRYSPTGELDYEIDYPFTYAGPVAVDELNGRLYATGQQGNLAIYDISGDQPSLIRTTGIQGMDLLLDAALDPLTGHLLVAGIGGVFEIDADGSFLLFNPDGHRAMTGVTALTGVSGEGADFNGDADLDAFDIDALTRAIASGMHDAAFDISGDGRVDALDRKAWLNEASSANGMPGIRAGDANLDGVVDALDFTAWNDNKFQSLAAWSKGDFNSDGIVDGLDFVIWHDGFAASNGGGLAAVPEPSSGVLMLAIGLFAAWRRRS